MCASCKPNKPPKLSSRTVSSRKRISLYVRRNRNFIVDGMYVDRSGYAYRENVFMGHVKNVVGGVQW